MTWNKADPRILRVAFVRDGRVFEERKVSGDRIAAPGHPDPVLIRRGRTWSLRVDATMAGRLAHGGGAASVEALRSGAPGADGRWEVPIVGDARGKLVLADVTVLFELCAPSRAAPLSFRPAVVSREDTVLVQSLGLFTGLGALFVAWVASVEPRVMTVDDLAPDDLVEQVGYVPMPPVPTIVELAAPSPEPATPARRERPTRKPPPRHPGASAYLEIQFPATRGPGEGTAVPFDDLPAIELALGPGASAGTHKEPRLRGHAGPGTAEDIEAPARIGGGDVQVAEARIAVTSEPPRLESDLSAPDAAAVRLVVERKRGDLKYCYEQQLRLDPGIAGRVEVDWVVRKGRVTAVDVVANTTGNEPLATCISGRISSWSFPVDLQTEVGWPFVFRASE